jgi:hypothetical protein
MKKIILTMGIIASIMTTSCKQKDFKESESNADTVALSNTLYTEVDTATTIDEVGIEEPENTTDEIASNEVRDLELAIEQGEASIEMLKGMPNVDANSIKQAEIALEASKNMLKTLKNK